VAPRTSRTRLQEQNRRFRLARKITRCEQRCAYCGLESASERRSDNRPALQRRYSKTKRDRPSRRAGVKRRKLLFSPKNREAWPLFLSKAGYSDHLQARWLTPALRDGADLESSVTGAEAPTYFLRACWEISRRSKERRGLTIVTRLELLERMAEESPSHRCRIQSDLRLGRCRAQMVV